MSEDLTKKTPDPESDQLTLILTIVKKLDKHEAVLTLILDRLDKLTVCVQAIEIRVQAIEIRLDRFEQRLDTIEKRLANSST